MLVYNPLKKNENENEVNSKRMIGEKIDSIEKFTESLEADAVLTPLSIVNFKRFLKKPLL